MIPSDAPLDPSPAPTRGCAYTWCTTAHGATSHADDEDHRSDGIRVLLVARGRERGSPASETDAEIGLLRRTSDDRTWLVIDDGGSVHLEITVESARCLAAAILGDPDLRGELRPGGR